MQGKITKSAVERLTPADGWLWDTALSGFGVRNQLRRPHYALRYRVNGRQRLLAIGPHGKWTVETARREAQRLLGLVATGVDPTPTVEEDKSDDTFASIAERYLAHSRARVRASSMVEFERHLRRHAAPLHSIALGAISRRDIAETLTRVETGSGVPSRNRVRSTLSAMYAWAIAEGLTETNPVLGTRKEDEGGARERVLSDGEIAKLWAALGDDDFSNAVRLLLLTGQRRKEIAELTWREINGATIVLPAHRTKNGREHTIPLSRQAAELLSALPRRSDRVFRPFSWQQRKASLDRRLGIAHYRLHDIRRSVATGMAELGIQPHVIESVLNHASGHKAGVAGIYNRSKLIEPMRNALQKWADHIEALIVGPRKQPVPTGLMERAFAVARGGKIVPNEDLANLTRQLKNKVTH
jgi:integrase